MSAQFNTFDSTIFPHYTERMSKIQCRAFCTLTALNMRFKGIAAYDMKVFSVLTHERAYMDFIIIECPISCFDHTHTRAHNQSFASNGVYAFR